MRTSISKTANNKRKSKRYEVPMFLSGAGCASVPLKNWSYAGFAMPVNNDGWHVGDKYSFWLSADTESDGGSVTARVLRITASEAAFVFEGLSNEAFDTMENSLRSKMAH
jgi:hypothetical protein